MRLEPRDDGTFLFPPSSYSDVASYADFWTRVEISDGVLANITKGYADLIRTQVSNLGVNWSQKYDYDHDQELHHGSESSRDAARGRRTAAWDKVKADVYTRCPEKIKAGTARTIARAGQAVFYRSALPDDKHDELTQSTMSILGEELSIREISARYQLGLIRDYFQDPEITSAQRLEELREELRNMQRI